MKKSCKNILVPFTFYFNGSKGKTNYWNCKMVFMFFKK
jgi:hypothetical protein